MTTRAAHVLLILGDLLTTTSACAASVMTGGDPGATLRRLDAAWRAVEDAVEAMMTPPAPSPADEARRATVDALIACADAILAETTGTVPAWASHLPAWRIEVQACPGPLTATRWVETLRADQHRAPRATLHWVDARRHIDAWRAALAQETDP